MFWVNPPQHGGAYKDKKIKELTANRFQMWLGWNVWKGQYKSRGNIKPTNKMRG